MLAAGNESTCLPIMSWNWKPWTNAVVGRSALHAPESNGATDVSTRLALAVSLPLMVTEAAP